MSVGATSNPKRSVISSLVNGKPFFVSDTPASRSSRLLLGEFQVTWYRPTGQNCHPVNASGASLPIPLHPRTWYDWVSANTFTLLRGEACHVSRPATLFNHSFR